MSQQDLQQKVEQLCSVLEDIQQNYAPAVFANSFGAEDMVLTDLIARHYPQIVIFTLDTGRLPQETYDLMQAVKDRYAVSIRAYCPDAASTEDYVAQHGPNGFYKSIALRKSCCYLRKVEPLKRALAGKKAWITGMRREQAVTRDSLEISAYDSEHGLHKFNPLCHWTHQNVWDYIKQHDVPYNALHDRFYPSIGCAPCTRAITPGEDVRSGRWWWENPDSKECGLHVEKK
ncbi:phosphoadenylyl-sulfate reductase [Nitrosomonas halophila]|uniref:Adenosine 5'-phosphosulfate reductase n=1 Tax=Nitrosomonas halophila TaxID=44576 RepID=A0A1H3DGF9_9PROT|nr:phosphoadenylyl-sulfate reductase [Nitrosomonas halophila]SDX65420.1 phosphoadenosine phosphosulfate reductase [Nitrosomonas halophila]